MSRQEDLLEDIEETRSRLGETVEELAHRLDVQARARDRMEALRENTQATATQTGRRVRHVASVAWDRARPIALRRGTRLAGVATLVLVVFVLARRGDEAA